MRTACVVISSVPPPNLIWEEVGGLFSGNVRHWPDGTPVRSTMHVRENNDTAKLLAHYPDLKFLLAGEELVSMGGDFRTAQLRLQRLLALIASGVALIVGVALPALVWQGEYWETEHNLHLEANIFASRVSEVVSFNPDLWHYLQHRIGTALEARASDIGDVHVQIHDQDGSLIFAKGDLPPAPHVSRQASLEDGFEQVGWITVTASLRPALYHAGVAAVGGALLAGLVLIALWRLPLRILSRTLGELESAEQNLRTSREELHSLNDELEAQVADLKHQMQVLHETKRRLSEAQRVAHIGNWELNLLTKELWWSDEVFRIFEIDRGGPDPTYEQFLNVVHPEDRDEVNQTYTESVALRSPYDLVHRLLLRNGRGKHVYERCETLYAAAGVALRSLGTVQDISPQYEAQRQLSHHRAQLRTLLDTLPDPVWLKDPEGIYLDCNKKFGRFFGAPTTDIIGKTDFDFVDEVLAAFFRQKDNDAMALGKPSVNEEWVTYADDGHRELLETIRTPMRNEQGELVGVLGIARDITERQQAEQARREGESRYRELVEGMSEGVAVYQVRGEGEDFAFKEHNRAGERITGMPREQVIGKPVRQVFPAIEAMGLFAVLQRVWRSGKAERHPVTEYQDGRLTLWVENFVFKLPSGEIVAVYADITERELAEQRLRQSEALLKEAQELAHLGNWNLDLTTGLAIWSDEEFRLLGYAPGEVIASVERFMNAVHPDDRKAVQAEMQRAMQFGEEEPYRAQHRVVLSDGSERVLDERGKVTFDNEGRPLRLFGTTLNITERKQAEDAIRTLNMELEQRVRERTSELQAANKELEAFAYSVSHDLRAPLRAIDGFSLAMVEDYGDRLDETALDYLQRLRNGAQRMGLLIDDLLQLSRVSRGELQIADVDLTEMARELAQELRATDPDRKVELTVEVDMWARGDPRLLRVMLGNLLSNAWKFTAREAVSRIQFRRRGDNPEVFSIHDNGVGFDMRHAEKLFGAFQRLHRVTDFPGTGVGLATVRRIVNRHGGRIWAEARKGQGATFYFTLGPERDA